METRIIDRTNATGHAIACVSLAVRDIDRVARFYRDVIGLPVQADEGATVRLGEGGVLELLHRPDARPASAHGAGLYHTAFLLPDRPSLGRWLNHASAIGLPLDGAADHLVSEAVYLHDPEGNGVEIYADRPKATWQWDGPRIKMANARLDIPGLRDLGPAPWTGAPTGTRIGHIHLRVGDATQAAAFYADALAMDVTVATPQAAFLSWDGYHHHLAANEWDSHGARARHPDETGLARVTLHGAGPAEILDPWGTRFRVVPATTETAQ